MARLLPVALVVLGLVLAWVLLQIFLHLLGIAASPLGWVLSLIGAIAGLATGKGG